MNDERYAVIARSRRDAVGAARQLNLPAGRWFSVGNREEYKLRGLRGVTIVYVRGWERLPNAKAIHENVSFLELVHGEAQEVLTHGYR